MFKTHPRDTWHTALWDEYGGGLRREGSFMEFVKHKLDEINAVYTKGALRVTDFRVPLIALRTMTA